MARWWARSAVLLGAFLAPVAGILLAPGCGNVTSETGGSSGNGGAGGGGGGNVTILHPDAPPLDGAASCDVTITTGIPVKSAKHVELCSHVKYATNPPSGGDHWPEWAAFQSYDTPVPREQYVHDLEHGALVLLYKCDGACPDVLAALDAGRAAVSGDALCLQSAGPTERVVITPDPLLDTPIAVAAWGATYTATCIDKASLVDFAKAHYGHGTEDICAQGYPIACTDAGADAGADGG